MCERSLEQLEKIDESLKVARDKYRAAVRVYESNWHKPYRQIWKNGKNVYLPLREEQDDYQSVDNAEKQVRKIFAQMKKKND